MAAGGALTIWDTVEGLKKAESDAKAITRNLIQSKIDQAGGNAKWLQEMGLIPSTERLKDLGFTGEELEKMGLLEDASACK